VGGKRKKRAVKRFASRRLFFFLFSRSRVRVLPRVNTRQRDASRDCGVSRLWLLDVGRHASRITHESPAWSYLRSPGTISVCVPNVGDVNVEWYLQL
jgi:hypothetical protein